MTPSPEAANVQPEKAVTLPEAIKWIAQFVGVVGGGGGGFAALAFGVGYLATKSHDAMLGLPTTATAYGTYVRTGALFFSRSLYDLVASIVETRWLFGLTVAVAAGALALGLVKPVRRAIAAGKPTDVVSQAGALALVYCILAGLVLSYLPYHLEPLDIRNTNLLFRGDEPVESHLAQVLQREDGEPELHRRYGIECAAVLSAIYVAWALRRWRGSVPRAGDRVDDSYWLGLSDWVARPLVYGVLLALTVTIPSVYGVLAIPPAYPCVELRARSTSPTTEEPPVPGYLWSDPSSEAEQIAVLERTHTGYITHFYKREQIDRLEISPCGVRNILAEKGTTPPKKVREERAPPKRNR